jgi:hypothetical protein
MKFCLEVAVAPIQILCETFLCNFLILVITNMVIMQNFEITPNKFNVVFVETLHRNRLLNGTINL